MDIGLIISILLQIGLGFALVIASTKKKNYIERHPTLWKIAIYVGLFFGWAIIVLSTGYLLIYLALFILSR